MQANNATEDKIVEANVINYEKFNNMDEDFDPDEWIVRITISQPLISKKLYTLKDYISNNNGCELHLVKYFSKFNQ